MESNGWRAHLPADARQRIVNKIMDPLKLHLPSSGHEGVQELRKIAMRFEDKIFHAATSQADYLRRISLKILSFDGIKIQSPWPYAKSSVQDMTSHQHKAPPSKSRRSAL